MKLPLNVLDPDKLHKDPYYNNFEVQLEFTDQCQNPECATRTNINDRMTKEQFQNYSMALVCPLCVEALGDTF